MRVGKSAESVAHFFADILLGIRTNEDENL